MLVTRLADLPDDAGPRDLHDRPVGLDLNGTGRSGLPTISRDTEVHQIEGAVRPELAIHGAVDPVERKGGRGFDERLIGRRGAALAPVVLCDLVCGLTVERESLEDDTPVLQEGDPDGVVALDGVAVRGLETEIAFPRDQRIPVFHRVARVPAARKGSGD